MSQPDPSSVLPPEVRVKLMASGTAPAPAPGGGALSGGAVPLRGKLRLYMEHAGGFFFGGRSSWKVHFVALDPAEGVVFCQDEQAFERGERSMVLPLSEITSVEIKTGGLFHICVRKASRGKFGAVVKLQASNEDEARSWTTFLADKILVRARVYTVGLNGEFPEQVRGVRPGTALCFSGGGGRAHVCAAGQLGALFHLGLLHKDKVDYISAVSAGAWATAIFTFYEKGADSDEALFGEPLATDLSKWNMNTLNTYPLSPILAPAHNDMWATASELIWVTNSHLLWEKSMGKVFLKPFGLNKDSLFCMREDEELIKTDNPQLRDVKFVTPKPGRPFWVAHGTIIGPTWAKVGNMLPIQFTPLYTGSPYLHKMHYHEKKRDDHELDVWVGGGMVDSFAFGGDEPEGLAKPPTTRRTLFGSSMYRRDSMRVMDYNTLRKMDRVPHHDDAAAAEGAVPVKKKDATASDHFGSLVLHSHRKAGAQAGEAALKKNSKHSVTEDMREAAATFHMGRDMITRVFRHTQEVFQAQEAQFAEVPKQELDSEGVMTRVVAIPHAATPFSLRHALGISSDAPSVNLHNRQIFQRLNVQQKYWTPVAAEAISSMASGRHLKPTETAAPAPAAPAATGGGDAVHTTLMSTGPPPAQSGGGGGADLVSSHKRTMDQRRESLTATHAITMDMGDGGSLDNLGLLGMLQRGVRRNIVFINTNNTIPHPSRENKTRLSMSHREGSTAGAGPDTPHRGSKTPSNIATPRHSTPPGGMEDEPGTPSTPPGLAPSPSVGTGLVFDKNLPPTWEEWQDDDILPMFGQTIDEKTMNYLGTHHGQNRVFAIEGLRDLLTAFQEKMEAGEPLVVEREYEVQENSFWGIEGGWKTQVLWVYLDDAEEFRKQLPKDTQEELLRGMKGEFARFPNFLTFGQQRGKAAIEIALTFRQINLLAAFNEWVVRRYRTQFEEFLTRPMEPIVRQRKRIEFCTNQLESEMKPPTELEGLMEGGFA